MKNFKLTIACLAMFAMIFTSCSKDEVGGADLNTEKATLSFGAIVNDLVANRAQSKQSIADLPVCSEDAPFFVRIVLMKDGQAVVGTTENPYRIDLVAGQLYTKDDPMLELTPGDYVLDHLAVYNEAGELIWVAPKAGSPLGEFVENPLPMDIDLRAGVKKYVEVDVLCFDDREVNEYGYLFFELDTNIALEFCFFVNYCPPNEPGRHYVANYSVSIWSGTTSAGVPLYTDEVVFSSQYDNGDYYTTPLCFALPDNAELNTPYLYYEVTLLDWPGNYGSVAPNTVISGTLTKQDILDNFDGDSRVDYEHLQFGCGDGPDDDCPITPEDSDGDCVPDDDDICPGFDDRLDADGDGIPDGCDNCPNIANSDQADTDEDGVGDACEDLPGDDCETSYMFGDVELNDMDYPGNNWGWGLTFNAGGAFEAEYLQGDGSYLIPVYAAAGKNDITKGWLSGHVRVTVDGSDVSVEFIPEAGVTVYESHIFIGDGWPASRAPGQLGNNYNMAQSTMVHGYTYSGDGSFNLIVHAVTCR